MIIFVPASQKWSCDLNCHRCKGRNKVSCLITGNGLTLNDAQATSLVHGVYIHQFMKPRDEWENRISYTVPQDDALLYQDVLEKASDTVH